MFLLPLFVESHAILYLVLPECNPVILTNCMTVFRHFDVGTSFYFLHAQKQLQPAPTLGTLTAAALLLFSKFLICKCFFLPLQQNHHCHKRRQEIRNRLGGNNTGKSGDL